MGDWDEYEEYNLDGYEGGTVFEVNAVPFSVAQSETKNNNNNNNSSNNNGINNSSGVKEKVKNNRNANKNNLNNNNNRVNNNNNSNSNSPNKGESWKRNNSSSKPDTGLSKGAPSSPKKRSSQGSPPKSGKALPSAKGESGTKRSLSGGGSRAPSVQPFTPVIFPRQPTPSKTSNSNSRVGSAAPARRGSLKGMTAAPTPPTAPAGKKSNAQSPTKRGNSTKPRLQPLTSPVKNGGGGGRTAQLHSPSHCSPHREREVGSGTDMEESLATTYRPEATPPARYNRAIVSETGGNRFLNDYLLFQDVGRGASGKVLMGYSMSRNLKVAIKMINKPKQKKYRLPQSDSALASLQRIQKKGNADDNKVHYGAPSDADRKIVALQREIEVMSCIQHENIVSLYEVIDDPRNNKLFLILQYVDDGPVATIDSSGQLSRTFTSEELLPIALQICSALHFVHRRRIVHRDIKPENILLSSTGEAFLADFGVAEIIEEGAPAPTIENCGYQGTPLFMPPELYARPEDLREITASPAEFEKRLLVDMFAMDVWSLGITFLSLLTGSVPFTSLSQIRAVLKTGFTVPTTVPLEWVAVLQAMLHPDQHKRATMQTVRKMMKTMEAEKKIVRPPSRTAPSAKSFGTKNLDVKFSTIKLTNEDDAVLTSMFGTMQNNEEIKKKNEDSFVSFPRENSEDTVQSSATRGRPVAIDSGETTASHKGGHLSLPVLRTASTPTTIAGKLNPWRGGVSESQTSGEDGQRRAQALMDAVKLKLT